MTRFLLNLIGVLFGVVGTSVADAATPDFEKDVAPIFAKYCSGCHNGDDREGELSLETFADLQQGGGRGAALVPGRADASLLVRALVGEVEPAMPPEDNERPTEAEISLLRAWIDAGAIGPDGAEVRYPEISAPEIAPAAGVQAFVTSLAIAPDGKRLAVGRYRHVDLVDPQSKGVLATTVELPGKVNRINYSADGALFVAASGVPGLYGVATICSAADGAVASQIKGHRDALYDAELSPDGKLLATCSYDRQIHLWDVASGKLIRSFAGHNGAVFDLAFTSDGAVLASASADGTVKIWKVATGERLDTLGQPDGEQCAVAISPDDNWVVAGGADGQLRMWQLVSRESAQINPLKHSATATESSIVQIAFSRDGSRVVSASDSHDLMLWDMAALTPLEPYEPQPDLVTGIAFEPDGGGFFVARIDGSWQRYPAATSRDTVAKSGDQANAPAPTAVTAEEPARTEHAEQEPNNSLDSANAIATHALVKGVIAAASESGAPDIDQFRFHAAKGQQLVLEINAARQKSPLDSRIAVLDASGNPVPRVLLQAVRPSYFTFRGHDSTTVSDFRLHRQQDMELNEFLYANGEVVKLWMFPRGPDSGFLVYPGIDSSRYTFFGTTAITHALNEPCYIVEPHPPGTKLIPNGLPEYTLYYENDDDGWRKLGTDSRVVFTAPADGDYVVRVADVRSQGGDEYRYELTVRAPWPDFQIKLNAPDLAISAGSGKEFSVVAERMDNFDGEINVAVEGLPLGFHVTTPLTIQAGQTTAYGTITADSNAKALTAENAKLAKLIASAEVNGKQVVKDAIDLGELKLAERPKVLVHVQASETTPDGARAGKPLELVVAPGETISAIVRVERNGFDGQISFGNEHSGRNLPHCVYVDNIGLNGLTLLEGESQRRFFITAAKGTPETTRPFHLKSDAEGGQTSWPIILHVRKQGSAQDGDRVAELSSANQ